MTEQLCFPEHAPDHAPDRAFGHPVLRPLEDVSRQHGLDPLAERLAALQRWLADDLADIEVALASHRGTVDLAQLAAGHLLERPGKRIRPLCVMLSARLGGRPFDPVVRDLGVAAELVHAATLLHDDVIDLGTERRGAPTSRLIYGNTASVLAGDFLLIEALERVRRSGFPDALARLLQAIQRMVAAEALQLARRGTFAPDRRTYLDIALGKTAALFEWAMGAGATAAGLDTEAIAAVTRAGAQLGVAFQIVDDVLDLEGDPAVTGKAVLTDLREGKPTWPVIEAVEADPVLAADLEQLALGGEAALAEADLGALRARIVATGALEVTRAVARSHALGARHALEGLPPGDARRALMTVVEAAVSRIA